MDSSKLLFHDFNNVLNFVRLKYDIFYLIEIDRNIFTVFCQGIDSVTYSNHHKIKFGIGEKSKKIFSKDVCFLLKDDFDFLNVNNNFSCDFLLFKNTNNL